MASIRKRERQDGGVTYTVYWRAGGVRDGKQESEIFPDNERGAERFCSLVEGHGNQWPPGWVRGLGFVEVSGAGDEGDAALPDPQYRFGTWAHRHIDLLTGVQGDTRAKYRKLVDENMLPWFKDLYVVDGQHSITRDHIAAWINDLGEGRQGPHASEGARARRKYRPKTVANNHGLLYGILQSAVDTQPTPLRAANPCVLTKLPRIDDGVEDEMCFLEREEYALLHAALHPDAVEMIDLTVGVGLRWGEVTALQPRDRTTRQGRPAIRIQRAWKRDEHGKPYLGAPKTKNSRRTLVLTPKMAAMVDRLCEGKARDALLFASPTGERWDAGTFRRDRWIPALQTAWGLGLTKEPRLHDLRHTHASWLIFRKVPLPAVQRRLGHESISITADRYGHLLDAQDDEIIEAVEWAMPS